MCPWILREALSQIRVSVTESGVSAAIGKKQIFPCGLRTCKLRAVQDSHPQDRIEQCKVLVGKEKQKKHLGDGICLGEQPLGVKGIQYEVGTQP